MSLKNLRLAEAVSAKNKYQCGIWKLVCRDLRNKYGEAVYRSWFSKINFHDFATPTVTISAPTHFIRDWLSANYTRQILDIWKSYDKNVKLLSIITDSSAAEQPAIEEKSCDQQKAESKYVQDDKNLFSQLDPRFSFDNFVVGAPNQLAYAAARAVAEAKSAVVESNPLFLYGGVGLGKTHLMQAIAWYIKNNHPSRTVVYMSAEKFMYQFVRALRNKDIMSFKEYFRSVDVLMIDDIQFICGKDSTQEEFFHTFNTLIDNNRQIVISCDRSPSDLDDIEDRIKSRLGWGLVADVHSTTFELRMGILHVKLEQMGISVPDDVTEFLARKITSNVRELEGALNKVIAHSNLIKKDITLESTQDILRDLLRSSEKIITVEIIQKKIAERYNIKLSDMSSAKRSRAIARPRQIAMYLSKMLTPKSLTDIGKKFGKKDHTTVMHAIKKVEDLCGSDLEFREEIDILTRVLQN